MWEKLKLLWKSRKEAQAVVSDIKDLKTGYKTWQFWLVFVGHLGSLLAVSQGGLDPRIALIANVVLSVLYNFLRGVVKSQTNGVKAWYKSTEFWFGIGVTVENATIVLQQGGIDPQWVVMLHTVLASVMVYAQKMGAEQPNGSGKPEGK